MYEEQFPPPASPRPFGEIPGLWTKVFQMTEQFFAQEAVRASGSNTLISVLIMGVVSSVLATISSLIWGGTQMAFLPPEYREAMAVGAGSNLVCSLCSTLIGAAIGFYLSNGLVYLGARIFGGTGDFTTQAYLASLFAVPVGIVSGLVGLVPCVGLIAVLAVSIYAVVLNVRAVKVTHNLTTGQAVAAVLVPALIIGVLVACLVVVGLAVLAPAIGNVFENIVTNLE
jgi:hypothetical protein